MNQVTTMLDAKAAGLTRYFTGKPCKYGHVAERSVASRMCVTCAQSNTRLWRKENKPHISEYNKNYLIENRAAIYANHTENRRKNPERVRLNKAADYQKHKSKRISAMKVWRDRNLDKVRAAQKRKVAESPEQYASYKRNYRVRKRSAAGSHTGQDILDILKLQKSKCACCHIKLGKGYHVDHIIPLKAGGSNDRRNLQILCAPCNQSKSARDPIEFMQRKGMLL